MYQSIDWGGSSFEGDVLTVSTQPGYYILALPLTCICLEVNCAETYRELGAFLVASRKLSMQR